METSNRSCHLGGRFYNETCSVLTETAIENQEHLCNLPLILFFFRSLLSRTLAPESFSFRHRSKSKGVFKCTTGGSLTETARGTLHFPHDDGHTSRLDRFAEVFSVGGKRSNYRKYVESIACGVESTREAFPCRNQLEQL
ncbi:hypothetical protein TGFOU_315855 [Toxoplasma gondii FOU]|uniref:Uncharacterized protein n=2 Tax=Toxoplasma gondii TaxID=5811 RepID=A0A086LIB9_TOXGO|nr:hypothetical protein TGFOU_315855 [Toxoplasma gondii FOU]PUA86660.1 hypothetical protein TGBR9_315855 [Toxoplasma gondii TgCATBr9]